MDQQGPDGNGPGTAAPSPDAIHFVRTLQTLTLAYSQMADQKASIVMGATFVVFTNAVGQIRSGGLPVSLTVLALFAFASALCAIFAVLPSVGGAKGTEANKLFFGQFAATPEADWIDSVLADAQRRGDFPPCCVTSTRTARSSSARSTVTCGWPTRVFIVGLSLTVVTFVCEMLGLVSGAMFLAD